MMTGAEVRAEIEALKDDTEKGGLMDMVRNTSGLINQA
jgi:hypothetical protein